MNEPRLPRFLVIAPTYPRAKHWATENGYLPEGARPDRYCAAATESTLHRLRGVRDLQVYVIDLEDWPKRAAPLVAALTEMGPFLTIHFHDSDTRRKSMAVDPWGNRVRWGYQQGSVPHKIHLDETTTR